MILSNMWKYLFAEIKSIPNNNDKELLKIFSEPEKIKKVVEQTYRYSIDETETDYCLNIEQLKAFFFG